MQLDKIAEDWLRLDFMKIDVEGWEPAVLDGAFWAVRQFRPVMLIEVNAEALGRLGFHPDDIYGRVEAVGAYRFEKSTGNYDLLCVPEGRE